MLLTLEKKLLEWLKNLLYKFCIVGALVLNTCGGVLKTLKTYLRLPEQRGSVGYEKVSACFQNGLPALVEAYAKVSWRTDFTTAGSKGAFEVRKVFL